MVSLNSVLSEALTTLYILQDEGEDGQTEDASASHAGRAKLTLLKKKLEEKERVIKARDETIQVREQQIEAKERVLAERDAFVSSLTEQLEEKTKTVENLQAGQGMAGNGTDTEQVLCIDYHLCFCCIPALHTHKNRILLFTFVHFLL